MLKPIRVRLGRATLTMDDGTLPLPGLSPVAGRTVKACFDGGTVSPDAGVLVLREVENRLGVGECLAGCLADPHDPALITHSLADMMRFRVLMIAAGYEDGNDATRLRSDPVFEMAQRIAPSGRDLASQPTISRLDNVADVRALPRMGGAMVDLYCTSFRRVPRQIVFDIDDTSDAVHGGQQLRLGPQGAPRLGVRAPCVGAKDDPRERHRANEHDARVHPWAG